MEKNPSISNNPKGVCERIYKAFVVGSQSIRRISTLPQESISAINSQEHSLPVHKIPHDVNKRMTAEVIQVEFPSTLPTKTGKEKRKEEMAEMVKKALAKPLAHVDEIHKPKSHMVQTKKEGYKDNSVHVSVERPKKAQIDDTNDHRFSDYINRAKLKIRATSDVGDGKGVGRKDSLNEKVSAYVDRAKLRLRKGSSIGGDGKSLSFK